jgi:2,4-dienoyl-CoA reductase-like NADH-dependent reductase (Old Yellow Enzyme family)
MIEGNSSVSSSDIPITGKAFDGTEYSASPPKPMTVEQIEAEVKEYAAAAKRSIEAGFDGVEIHGCVSSTSNPFLILLTDIFTGQMATLSTNFYMTT